MSSEFVTVLGPQPDDRPLAMEAAEARSEVHYVGGAELGEAIASADALFVWDFFSAAVAPAWGRADRPRWVHVAAAGVDRLLFPELVESDVVLTSARGVFDRPIAEYVLGLVLAHVTDLRGSWERQRERRWKPRFHGSAHGQHVLVVGTGSIGCAVTAAASSGHAGDGSVEDSTRPPGLRHPGHVE